MARLESDSPRAKRRKIDTHALPEKNVTITSHKHLRDLLFFRQNLHEAKQGKRPLVPGLSFTALLTMAKAQTSSKNSFCQSGTPRRATRPRNLVFSKHFATRKSPVAEKAMRKPASRI